MGVFILFLLFIFIIIMISKSGGSSKSTSTYRGGYVRDYDDYFDDDFDDYSDSETRAARGERVQTYGQRGTPAGSRHEVGLERGERLRGREQQDRQSEGLSSGAEHHAWICR